MKMKRKWYAKLLSLSLAAGLLLSTAETESVAAADIVYETNIEEDTGETKEALLQDVAKGDLANSDLKKDGTAADSLANPTHHCTKKNDGSDYTEWSYVYFGSYPQTEVKDAGLTSAIINASYDNNGDAWVGNMKYRRISKNEDGQYRYFKWERIKWRILKNDGETLFVAADKALDCKDYHNVDEAVTWENCTIRQWLNHEFYNTAFSGSEQSAIAEQNIVNEDIPGIDHISGNLIELKGGNDTRDSVFLLSYGEVINEGLGFCSDENVISDSRHVKSSDYAVYKGANADGFDSDYDAWLLRAPYDGYDGSIINVFERVGYDVWPDSEDVGFHEYGCVPALHIDLSSDLWYMTDDGTSGAGGYNTETPGTETLPTETPGTETLPTETLGTEIFSTETLESEAPSTEVTEVPEAGGEILEKEFDNYAVSFPTIKGGSVSTTAKASKEATILIFGSTTCASTAMTLQGIAKSNWGHSNKVKVIYVDINGADADAVTEFAKKWGSSRMTFCYDPDGTNSKTAVRYLISGGHLSGPYLMPVTVLIGADDRVHCMYTHYRTADVIYDTLREFASVSPEDDPAGEDAESGWKDEGGDSGSTEEAVERELIVSGQENYDAAYQALDLVNQTRAASGAESLTMDRSLMETAMLRAAELSLYYSHTRPNGEECFSIFRQSGYKGENIAVGYPDANQVMDGWNQSPGHYANIINEKFTGIGIGCFIDSEGTYYWVQCFDSESASDPGAAGITDAEYNIPILQSFISLSTKSVEEFGCGSSETEVYMDIHNNNNQWNAGKPELSPDNFNFVSDNPAVAEVNDTGIITIKAAGTAVITASLKDNPALQVSRAVTKKAHVYKDTVVAPTDISQGYTRHTCTDCNDSYVDTFVPPLSQTDSETTDSEKPVTPTPGEGTSTTPTPGEGDQTTPTPGEGTSTTPTPGEGTEATETPSSETPVTPTPSTETPSTEPPVTTPTTTYTYKLNSDNKMITITKCVSSDSVIAIPSSIDGYTVTEIGDSAFANVTSMKTVSFPSTLKEIGTYAFAGCTSLTSVVLPNTLSGLGNYSFKGCTSLRSVVLNAGRINISQGLFSGCRSLNSVTVPDSVQYIRESAFEGCVSLKTLRLPKSLKIVYKNAFLNSGITTVSYTGTSADWKTITIYTTGNTAFLNTVVTDAAGKTYSANKNNWSAPQPAPVKKPSVSKVSSFKVKAGKKKLTLSWKKLSGAAGYQIQVSTKKSFKGANTISVSKSKKSYTKKRLKAKKKYYVRIRAYKTYKDAYGITQRVYGKWTSTNKKTK